MITIVPKLGRFTQITGALIAIDQKETWTSDYYTVRGPDGAVRFKIRLTLLLGADIVLAGQRYPLSRGVFGMHRKLYVGESATAVSYQRQSGKVYSSWGKWKAELDPVTYTMNLEIERDEPEFLFVLAGAHQLWAANIGS